jgi:signal transduction histidine kinase
VLFNASIFRNDSGEVQGIFATARDITERKRAEEEVRKSHDEFRMLANHLQNIREEERNRLAREFHDQIGQSMTALKMDLSLLLRKISDEKQDIQRTLVAEELQSMQKLVDETSQLLWAIVTELRPQMLEDLGLITTFDWEAKRFESRTGITCEFKSSEKEILLDQKISIALFRIYQEALTNVARHANATAVKSILRREHEMMVLEIKDNGCGISLDKKSKPESFGLIGMRERAVALGGLLEISGSAGEGTTIIVRLPLEQIDEQESTKK